MSYRDSQTDGPRKPWDEPWRPPEAQAEARAREAVRAEAADQMARIWRGPGSSHERMLAMRQVAERAGAPELADEFEAHWKEGYQRGWAAGVKKGAAEARERLAAEARAERALRAAGLRRRDGEG